MCDANFGSTRTRYAPPAASRAFFASSFAFIFFETIRGPGASISPRSFRFFGGAAAERSAGGAAFFRLIEAATSAAERSALGAEAAAAAAGAAAAGSTGA